MILGDPGQEESVIILSVYCTYDFLSHGRNQIFCSFSQLVHLLIIFITNPSIHEVTKLFGNN